MNPDKQKKKGLHVQTATGHEWIQDILTKCCPKINKGFLGGWGSDPRNPPPPPQYATVQLPNDGKEYMHNCHEAKNTNALYTMNTNFKPTLEIFY